VLESAYLTGLWVKSLREDIVWSTVGDEASFGRVRNGPSWTWAAAADIRIEWPRIQLHPTFQVEGTSFDEETQGLNLHSYAEGSTIHISGLLQPVSIRTQAKLDRFEKTFPLARYCKVVEWRRRHSEHSQQLVRCHGALVEPVENGQRKERRDVDSSEKPTMYGDFCADYRFWETEEELRETLQHVYFLFLGTESDTDPLWIDGIVLKPRLHQWDDSKAWYERIGWLRYCTLESVKGSEWTPRGIPSKLRLF
jgi:hypothetical protein